MPSALAHGRSSSALSVNLLHVVVRPADKADATAILEGGAMGAEEAAYNADLFGHTITHTQAVVDSSQAAIDAVGEQAAEADAVVAHVPEADALQSIVDVAREADTLVVNASSRDDVLRGTACDAHLFHVMASDAQFVDALVTWMRDSAAIASVAVVHDGAASDRWAYAEERLADTGIQTNDLLPESEAPAATATDADAIWLDADGDALSSALNALSEFSGPILCPHLSRAAHGRATGPVLWHEALFKYGAKQVTNRFAERTGQAMEGLAYAHWAAMQILSDAMLQTNTTDTAALRSHLRTQTRFDGRKAAPITFRPWNQQARHELYIVEPSGDGSSVAGPVPQRMPEAPDARQTALDALGRSAEAAGCSL